MSTLKTVSIQHPDAPSANIAFTNSSMTLSSASVTNNFFVNGGTLFADAANNRVGIGTLSPQGMLHVVSSGNTYMKIDSSGRITKPSQTAFHAKVTTATSYAQYADIVFGLVVYNIGSAYNSSNGRFTAPVSGMYHIYSMVRIELASSTYWHSWFKVNGNSVYTTLNYGLTGLCSVSGTSFNAGSTSFNIYLNSGDYITSAPWAGTYNISDQSYFGGYLLG